MTAQPFPYGPLREFLARDRGGPGLSSGTVAVLCGVDRRTVERWKTGGLSDRVADQVATHLGRHPDDIWPPPAATPVGVPVDVDGPAVTTLDDHRDGRLEAILAGHGTAWEMRWVKTVDVDWDATQARQVRRELVDPELVDTYRIALLGGAVFPAVLAVTNGDTGYVELLAGVHRTNAYETAGLPEVPAYVLDPGPGPQVEYLIAVEDNTTHGAALTHDERIEHALRMVDLGFTRAEAARRSGLNANKVYSAVKVRHSGKVLAGFGLATQWAKLPASSQWRLATASQGDTEVLAEAVMTAVGAHLVSKQVFELASVIGAAVKAGGKTGGTAAALQAIEDYEIQVDTSSRAASRWTASSSSSSSSSSA